MSHLGCLGNFVMTVFVSGQGLFIRPGCALLRTFTLDYAVDIRVFVSTIPSWECTIKAEWVLDV